MKSSWLAGEGSVAPGGVERGVLPGFTGNEPRPPSP